MTVATLSLTLTEAARALIDTRLDTIDRMLLGRVPRADRLAIVKDVEAQIHEHLQESESDEIDRESVLAVLARLDPPEAYLPEEGELEPVETRIMVAPRSPRYGRSAKEPTIGKASGIVGIVALVSLLLIPLAYLLGILLQSELLMIFGWGLGFFLSLVGGIVGLVLGACARPRGAWSVTGMVTGGLAILASLVAGVLVMLLLMST